ncbi:MAG: hypothetical protein U0457_03205 [Candidatus Sericytochromatia bacterium]
MSGVGTSFNSSNLETTTIQNGVNNTPRATFNTPSATPTQQNLNPKDDASEIKNKKDSKYANDVHKFNDGILFVGMNEGSDAEVEELKKNGAKVDKIDNKNTYTFTFRGQKFDISKYEDKDKLMALLNIPEDKRKAFKDILNKFASTSGLAGLDILIDQISIAGRGGINRQVNLDSFIKKNNEPYSREEFIKDLKNCGLDDKTIEELKNSLGNTGANVKGADNKNHNLFYKEDIKSFVASLGLPKEQAEKLEKILYDTPGDARDEVAQIMLHFAKAEKGGQIPSRLVISGHSSGDSYWGDGNGSLTKKILSDISKAMPKAASQIEDLAFSACNSGHRESVDFYKEVFPNMKTFMGYVDSAPGSSSGSTNHLKKWEKATRGDSQEITPDMFNNTRKGTAVSVWTKKGDFKLSSKASKDIALYEIQQQINNVLPKYLDQDNPVTDTRNGELRELYTNLQRITRNPPAGITPEELKDLEKARDTALRLLFYTDITSKFNNAYRGEIDKGFKEAGLETPNFSKMPRAKVREQVEKLQNKILEATKKLNDEKISEFETAEKDLKNKEESLEKQKSEGKITDAEYMNEVQKLQDNYNAKVNEINEKYTKKELEIMPEARKALELLEKGLIELDKNIIPDNWV